MSADNDNLNATPDDNRRRKLKFRAWHRGMKEMDLLLGGFADRYIDEMSLEDLDRFEAMMHFPDQAFYQVLVSGAPVPPQYDHDLMHRLIAFVEDPERQRG